MPQILALVFPAPGFLLILPILQQALTIQILTAPDTLPVRIRCRPIFPVMLRKNYVVQP